MNELNSVLKEKLNLLELWYSKRKGSIVAYSGGIDSTLVLYLARKFQGRGHAIGVISNSESLKNKDFNLAQSFCEGFDIQLSIIKTNELTDSNYSQNPINRCFYCKDHLFHDLQEITKEYPGFEILSGTNFDDLGDYRPGIDAAQKNSVMSPLVDCKVNKEEIREIARHFGLPNWNKPASPCLSSRIPYNQAVTLEKLRQIEAAEDLLNSYGFEDVRVRHFGTFGKIEVQKDDLENLLSVKDIVIGEIKKIGFVRIEIDEEGLVSGKMNRVLSTSELKNNKI
ncbi:MAG TPA: ATP-dependent sacrificial sulfur transferase LarE [Prolixibacteraceae bacterium]|nr:ATP-dependent sacrificial sulfur transferase LarE [Prolixibacteraceae bacterium]